jgi:hypothetical protein
VDADVQLPCRPFVHVPRAAQSVRVCSSVVYLEASNPITLQDREPFQQGHGREGYELLSAPRSGSNFEREVRNVRVERRVEIFHPNVLCQQL